MNCHKLETRILVVCDSTYGSYFRALLERAGFGVTLTHSCQQAMVNCQLEHYALVLVARDPSDILVEALCRQLRAEDWYRSRPLVVLLHGNDLGKIQACFGYGVSEVICSPISGDELVLRLRALMNRHDQVASEYADISARLTATVMQRYDRLRSDLEASITQRIYCETIYSVTEGHFVLLDYSEFDDYLRGLEPKKQFSSVYRVPVEELTDVDKAIDTAEGLFDSYQSSHPEARFDEDDLADMSLCCSELACNIIKHGGGHGEVNFNINDDDVRIYSGDCGSGINPVFLANALFMGGASARKSFGFGFTILYEIADFIVMTTGTKGTRLMLIKSRTKVQDNKFNEILARF